MKHFMYKLIAPRPSFNLDMNEEEQAAMNTHMAYWAELTKSRKSIVYGPVFDPAGVYGMAIIEVETEDEANAIAVNDPAVSSGICSYQLFSMAVGMVRD